MDALIRTVSPLLSDEACELALQEWHGGIVLPNQVWVRIADATRDGWRGGPPSRRQPLLDEDEATVLQDFYFRLARAFNMQGDSPRALICLDAEVAIRRALRLVAMSHS